MKENQIRNKQPTPHHKRQNLNTDDQLIAYQASEKFSTRIIEPISALSSINHEVVVVMLPILAL